MSPYRHEEFERGQSQASYFPSGPNELEQSDSDYQSPPKKRARRNPSPGNPARDPCAECATKMVDEGSEFFCLDQHSSNAVRSCYKCAIGRRRCPPLPPHAVEAGRRLQEAAVLMNNGQDIPEWLELAALFREVMKRPEIRIQQPEAPDLHQALEDDANNINQAPGDLARVINQCVKQALEDQARDTRLALDQIQEINQAQEVTNAWLRLFVDQNNERMRAMETLLRQVLDERRRPDVAAERTYSPSPLPPNAE